MLLAVLVRVLVCARSVYDAIALGAIWVKECAYELCVYRVLCTMTSYWLHALYKKLNSLADGVLFLIRLRSTLCRFAGVPANASVDKVRLQRAAACGSRPRVSNLAKNEARFSFPCDIWRTADSWS